MNIQHIASMVLFHRRKSGLSREQCARLAGVGKTVIYDIEHSKPTVQLDTLFKIFAVLNITIAFNSPLMAAFQNEVPPEK